MSVTERRESPSYKLLQALPTVDEVLEKALDGERIGDEDAIALLRSRDLVAVGRVANEVRNRLNDPSRVTFIVDRNLNYTNVCVTDCDFCAFYRRPGDQREGYLLPKPVIFKKIEETLALGGTGLLMQGGHHPDLAIDYYEDLFRSIKARYPIHLHALSPPEIQHIARRSKLTVPETLARLRDEFRPPKRGHSGLNCRASMPRRSTMRAVSRITRLRFSEMVALRRARFLRIGISPMIGR